MSQRTAKENLLWLELLDLDRLHDKYNVPRMIDEQKYSLHYLAMSGEISLESLLQVPIRSITDELIDQGVSEFDARHWGSRYDPYGNQLKGWGTAVNKLSSLSPNHIRSIIDSHASKTGESVDRFQRLLKLKTQRK